MTNIEYYKEKILINGFIKVYEKYTGLDYEQVQCINWLCEKYIGPVLDGIERDYFKTVIAPFKSRVNCIYKTTSYSKYGDTEEIVIGYDECFEITLPDFKKGTMYKNMELDKEYTLEELGL